MIVLTPSVAQAMRQAAEAAYPEECCGLLVGRADDAGSLIVTRAVAAANVAADRRRRFEVDPALRFRLLRSLRDGEEAMVGNYHSHPDHPAVPSAFDLTMAFEPALVWLIIAVEEGHAGLIAAFRPRADGTGFAPLAVRFNTGGATIGRD